MRRDKTLRLDRRTTTTTRGRARELRSDMSSPEVFLWLRLRRRQVGGFAFNRQKPIGPFVADFYCHRAMLVVEVDGAQHLVPEAIEYDASRDRWMRERGLEVLRFDASSVIENTSGVVWQIQQACEARAEILEAKRRSEGNCSDKSRNESP